MINPIFQYIVFEIHYIVFETKSHNGCCNGCWIWLMCSFVFYKSEWPDSLPYPWIKPQRKTSVISASDTLQILFLDCNTSATMSVTIIASTTLCKHKCLSSKLRLKSSLSKMIKNHGVTFRNRQDIWILFSKIMQSQVWNRLRCWNVLFCNCKELARCQQCPVLKVTQKFPVQLLKRGKHLTPTKEMHNIKFIGSRNTETIIEGKGVLKHTFLTTSLFGDSEYFFCCKPVYFWQVFLMKTQLQYPAFCAQYTDVHWAF